jgi:glycerol-3-phosphate acyltransferase PlsY
MAWHYALIPVAYLLGSVACAVVVCRAMSLPDPRGVGSKNPGATNVLRANGKLPAILTLGGDILKGLLPVLLGRWLGANEAIVAAIGVAAFVGHLFPIFFGFRGGKGVATFIGVLLGFHYLLGVTFVSIWLLMALLFRISSLAALTGAVLMPLVSFYALPSSPITAAVMIMSALVIMRHHRNIRNLLAGTEDRMGKRGT